MRQIEPTTIIAGETLEWTKSYDDHPATLWTLAYRFRGPGIGIDAAGVADGTDFIVTVPTTTTDNFAVAGKYKWEAWVTEIADATNRQLVGSGFVNVSLALVSSTAAVEIRTPAKIMLDTLDAALLAAGSADHIEYEISTPAGSRRIKREPRKDVIEQRKYWIGIVARENAMERVRNGGPFNKSVVARLHE